MGATAVKHYGSLDLGGALVISAPKGRNLWFYILANDRKVNLEDTSNLMFSVRLFLGVSRLQAAQTVRSSLA